MKAKGYTFAEMMVVMAIIALMMAILVPRFAFQQRGVALKGAAGELASALRTARRLAITNRELTALAIDIYSIPAEFVMMREENAGSCDWAPIGEYHRLPDNIAIVAVTGSSWSSNPLDITRTDDQNTIDSTEDLSPACPDRLFNPGSGNGIVNTVYHLIRFQPTGTVDGAMIYLWNVTEGRQELPASTDAHALSNLHALGVPPGLTINDATRQDQFFNVATSASEADSYYYTLVVNPITGGVMVYDYAWGTGSGIWDRKKDGE
jgi:prepilin-type N-terminal cleavage/methylation domain-containing protein